MAERHIVYVHGICKHEPGFSNPWFSALGPFVPSLQPGNLGGNRHEVLWSDIVNPPADDEAAPLSVAARIAALIVDSGKHEQMKHRLMKSLEDRIGGNLLRTMNLSASATDAIVSMEAAVGIPSIPGLNCIDDFVNYLADDDVRQAVLSRFEAVIKPLLADGHTVEVVGHSWGTVVAYEGLRSLDGENVGAGQVHNFFSVGSALSISLIRSELLPNASDGKRPQVVERWVNLDARGDIVGGSLIDEGFEVSPEHEFLDLEPVGCSSFAGIFVNPSCAHASYFRPTNQTVNKGIFANFIEPA